MITNSKKQIPTMLVRMRCPDCLMDMRFCVEVTTPLAVLPELTKKSFKCYCKNHIPKIGKTTPIEKTLMSINAVPLRTLLNREVINA